MAAALGIPAPPAAPVPAPAAPVPPPTPTPTPTPTPATPTTAPAPFPEICEGLAMISAHMVMVLGEQSVFSPDGVNFMRALDHPMVAAAYAKLKDEEKKRMERMTAAMGGEMVWRREIKEEEEDALDGVARLFGNMDVDEEEDKDKVVTKVLGSGVFGKKK